jgi:hypothetical protein
METAGASMNAPPVGPAFNGTLPDNLEPLKAHARWCVWRFEPGEDKDGNPKWDKVPYQPKHPTRKARTNTPSDFALYDVAVETFNRDGFSGVGFLLAGKEFAAFDLDKCVSYGPSGEIILTPKAKYLVEKCGSYCELTPSGEGLRILGLSRDGVEVQTKFPVKDNPDWSLEVYRNTARYITITGVSLEGYDLFPVCIDEQIEQALLAAPPTAKVDSALASAAFKAGDFSGYDSLEDAVDADILEIIRTGVTLGDRSSAFHVVVCKLFAGGFSSEQIVDLLKRYPHSIAAKYLRGRGRLEREVKRSWDKAGSEKAKEADSQNVEVLPARCASNVVVVAVNAEDAKAIAEATGYEVRYALDGCVIKPEPRKRFVYALVNGSNKNPTKARM